MCWLQPLPDCKGTGTEAQPRETVPWAAGQVELGWGAVAVSPGLQGTLRKSHMSSWGGGFLGCQIGQTGPSPAMAPLGILGGPHLITGRHRMEPRSHFKDIPSLSSSPSPSARQLSFRGLLATISGHVCKAHSLNVPNNSASSCSPGRTACAAKSCWWSWWPTACSVLGLTHGTVGKTVPRVRQSL